jgi:AraC-like DNA-binding protein
MSTIEILDILARGATSGLAVVLALLFLRDARHSLAARLGILFAVGVACYALLSSNPIAAAMGPLNPVMNILAIPTGVFFWWFTTALFDTRFSWHWWRWLPLSAVVLCASGNFLMPPDSLFAILSASSWQLINIGLMVHAAVLALRDWGDDLIERRRKFRIAFAILVAILGIAISALEMRYAQSGLPAWVFPVHGFTLLALSLGFTGWLIAAPTDLFSAEQAPQRPGTDRVSALAPEDRPLARRLEAAMAEGLYREPGLTVGLLAQHLGTREHRLRRIINQGLGYRNFSAFLNTHRLAEAKRLLADPDRAHDQVLTLALDLGYGSIAPFNRAFRAETGTTPTLFRRQALAAK